MKMPFGKFKGVEVSDLPEDYLLWLDEEVKLFGPLKRAVESALGIKHGSLPPMAELPDFNGCEEMASEIIKRGYRECSKRHHPDVGGSNEKMAELNEAYEILCRIIPNEKIGDHA